MAGLADRAAALLRAHGPMTSDALCRALFAGVGPAWDRLLSEALRGPRFERDGPWWRLAETPVESLGASEPDPAPSRDVSLGAPADAPTDPVAFVVEATGQDPARHRIVQIAACRIVDGAPGPTWFSHVDPGRRLPRWLADRLGVDDTFGEDAPSFATAWRNFLDFVGDASLIGF
ncbi:MAG: exonuclease domain-containing protein, partial [Dehalococcoidia bacterium]|nr:exonuclease domain-containing protein [Dehalococcoidia bacterium]